MIDRHFFERHLSELLLGFPPAVVEIVLATGTVLRTKGIAVVEEDYMVAELLPDTDAMKKDSASTYTESAVFDMVAVPYSLIHLVYLNKDEPHQRIFGFAPKDKASSGRMP